MEPLRQGDPPAVGPYQLERRLGGGGMGEVFLGWSPGGRPVAVKIVRPELVGDAGFRRRFALEAEAARQVGGFYTAQVVDADLDADPPWLVTAYIPGPSLQEAVKQHGLLPMSTLSVLAPGLAEGLAAIHRCGLVHRDLKPSNVILAEDGPRVIDFGIARALDATSHTTPRAVLGTPSFMSPEQARGDEVGPPSDVFSLASVLVYAATGRTPFGTGPAHALPYRIVHEKPDLSGVPASLRGLLADCLAKSPAARPTVADILVRLTVSNGAATRWLPPDLTTLISERRTATGKTDPASPGANPKQATLEIGNLAYRPLDVIVDRTALGRVSPGGRQVFQLAPGSHSLQVRAGRRRGTPRRIETPPSSRTRLAFGMKSPSATPVPVDAVVFPRSGGLRDVPIGLACGLAVGLGPALAVGLVGGGSGTSLVVMLLYIVMFSLSGGIAALLIKSMGFRPRSLLSSGPTLPTGDRGPPFGGLTLRSNGLTFDPGRRGTETVIDWDVLERISLIGDGRDAKLAAWYREGHRPTNGVDVHGGVLVCEVKGLIGGQRNAELRRALRWFAPDLYSERSP
ncbi:serine/threonine protein kinase [Actinomadura madurae]|uniref:protein kinase domain-containing protein n=1 Tax=Actinomadura madurae TaxID=1993 RepID=UPI00399BCD15